MKILPIISTIIQKNLCALGNECKTGTNQIKTIASAYFR